LSRDDKCVFRVRLLGFEFLLWFEFSEAFRVVAFGEESFFEARFAVIHSFHGSVATESHDVVADFAPEARLVIDFIVG